MKMHYRRWIQARIKLRRDLFRPSLERNLFSLITPVYNTPAPFLRAMARSVFAQDYPLFEWVLVDNGCTYAETRAELNHIRRDRRVVFQRLEANRGIMGGTRAAVAAASGRYLLPVDSDDRLYPDALRVMATSLQRNNYPVIAYSDEDKLTEQDEPCHPFLKPDWDPVLFFNICYVAHLCAIEREEAMRLEAYTDNDARGCHDWDTFWRFVRASHTPLHVPEVLYSWRMHAGSTSTPGLAPKDYTLDSQEHVLTSHLERIGAADRHEVHVNPLFGDTGLWQVARRHADGPSVHLIVTGCEEDWRTTLSSLAECAYPGLNVHLLMNDLDQEIAAWNEIPGAPDMAVSFLEGSSLHSTRVAAMLGELGEHAPVAFLHADLVPLCLDWPWEAVGLLELFPEAALIGGRVYNAEGRIVSAGEVFGMDEFLGCPNRHLVNEERGWYGLHICQRSVDAVSGDFFIGRAGFLRQAFAGMPTLVNRSLLSAYLGIVARTYGQRVIYSPHVVAQYLADVGPPMATLEERAAFVARFSIPQNDGRTYSPFLSLDSTDGFSLADPNGRTAARYQVSHQRIALNPEYAAGLRVTLPAAERRSTVSPVRP